MEITFLYKNLTKVEERQFVEYVEQKRKAIESLLTKFASDAKQLNAAIEKFEKHDAYQVEFCLTLPAKALVSREASHSITKAVDLSKDRLIIQLKKHIALLRKDRAHKSIREVAEKVGVPAIAE
jgi:ribosome-associated translation inhibitor RaiA